MSSSFQITIGVVSWHFTQRSEFTIALLCNSVPHSCQMLTPMSPLNPGPARCWYWCPYSPAVGRTTWSVVHLLVPGWWVSSFLARCPTSCCLFSWTLVFITLWPGASVHPLNSACPLPCDPCSPFPGALPHWDLPQVLAMCFIVSFSCPDLNNLVTLICL